MVEEQIYDINKQDMGVSPALEGDKQAHVL